MSSRVLNQAANHGLGQTVAKFTLRVAIAAIATLPVAALGVSSARAEDSYGAIARSRSTEGKGYSWNYATRAAAENRAYRECESVSGNGDCQVLLWFRNACGSIAESTTGAAGTGWGTSPALAERYAMDSCAGVSSYSRCSITRTFCSPQ
ncbi:hypothetical protein Pse7367_3313 [Thalassoporum mexicanum PCC 7367]|uniref:DUF4189 domain-containing protein n=1 Tax=Thalassoporum mexicanum TaxID=3457544 RepID=UPI00029FC5BA|nr:DUF4189 domain-containing protein [Pseudanabaena sp. PCC 7367]AFY71553.1 hypothetical protein Pse7367_3313 [Pseudanabaena sp. PCC 7367]